MDEMPRRHITAARPVPIPPDCGSTADPGRDGASRIFPHMGQGIGGQFVRFIVSRPGIGIGGHRTRSAMGPIIYRMKS